jgi:hypothetical protein
LTEKWVSIKKTDIFEVLSFYKYPTSK